MEIEIHYLDFGKPFPENVAGEFIELAFTENFVNHPATARVERENVLNIPLRTTAEEKYLIGRGTLAVVCKPTSGERLQYSLLQPRSEKEYIGDLSGRFFFQRRHMLVKQTDLLYDFMQGKQSFTSLLEIGCQDGEQRNDKKKYYLVKYLQPKNLVSPLYYELGNSTKSSKDKKNHLVDTAGKFTLQDDKILFLSNSIIETAGTGKSGKNQVRVFGKISLEEKLKIVDAVQRLVYHKLNWICFATDYVTETSPSDRMTILFLESERESDKVPSPALGFISVDWENLGKRIGLSYFDELREIEGYGFNFVNRALFNPKCKNILDIVDTVKKYSFAQKPDCRIFPNLLVETQREYIKEFDNWLPCLKNTSQFSFGKWLDLLTESQKPMEDLVKILLHYANESSRYLAQDIENFQNREKIHMILDNAISIGAQKQSLFLLKQLPPLRIGNFESLARKYISRFGYDNSFYEVLIEQSKFPPLGTYTLCAGLVAAVTTGNIQDIASWVDKTNGVAESVTGVTEILRMYSRRNNPNWADDVIPYIENEVGTLDKIKVKRRLIEELKKLDEAEPSPSSDPGLSPIPAQTISLESLAKEIESFLSDDDPFIRTLDLLSLRIIDPNEIRSNPASLFVLSAVKRYKNGSDEDKGKILAILREIINRLTYKEPEKPKETVFSRFRIRFFSWKFNLTAFLQSLRRVFWKLVITAGIITLIGLVIKNWPLLAPIGLNLLPTPQEVFTSTPLLPIVLPEVTLTPSLGTSFSETNLPIGILVYDVLVKSNAGDITNRPIRYISSDNETVTDVDFGELIEPDKTCMNSVAKEIYLYKWDDNFLLLSTAFPCNAEYLIAARMYMKPTPLRFINEPGVGRNAIIEANSLLVVTLAHVNSIRFINQSDKSYVSFLASKDPETPASPYWVVHNLSGSQAAFSFLDLGDGSITIERKKNLSEATPEFAYNIHSYEWINNNTVLFLVERHSVYQWVYISFNFEKLEIDSSNTKWAVYSSQSKTVIGFSLNKDGAIALIYEENGAYYFQYCQLNKEHQVECNSLPVLLAEFKEIYQIMWSPNNIQIAITASTPGIITIKDSDNNPSQIDCSIGCLFLANTNTDGALSELLRVKNITEINHFWWIDHTIPANEGE